MNLQEASPDADNAVECDTTSASERPPTARWLRRRQLCARDSSSRIRHFPSAAGFADLPIQDDGPLLLVCADRASDDHAGHFSKSQLGLDLRCEPQRQAA